jgi:hypothetical protein
MIKTAAREHLTVEGTVEAGKQMPHTSFSASCFNLMSTNNEERRKAHSEE